MSKVPQLFNLSSVPHSPEASHSSPRSTSRQFGNSVSGGGQKSLGSTSRQSSSHDSTPEDILLASTDGIVVGGDVIGDIVGCSDIDAMYVGDDVSSFASLGMAVSGSGMLATFAVISSSGQGSNSQLLLGSCRTILPPGQERTSAEQPFDAS